MLLDYRSQYFENDYTTQNNLQMQCNPYQITVEFLLTKLEKKILQYVWKHER